MSVPGFRQVSAYVRFGAPALLVMLLASCDSPTRVGSLTVNVEAEPSEMVGERQTGLNAGNVLCQYFIRATIEMDAGVTAHWLSSRSILRFSGNTADTLEASIDETQEFWQRQLLANDVLTRHSGWNGPEILTPVTVETTYRYQVDGKAAPDSVSYTFQCR